MTLVWTVTEEDVSRVRSFVAVYAGNLLALDRKRRNLTKSKPKVSRQQFWHR